MKNDPQKQVEPLVAQLRLRLNEAREHFSMADAGTQELIRQIIQEAGAAGPDKADDTASSLARLIDHTALKPETTEKQIRRLCEEARRYRFASVCVNPCYVGLAAELLAESSVEVCTVTGFPLGADYAAVKARETALAVEDGATEVDMVMNVGLLKSGRYEAVADDIWAVAEAAAQGGRNTDGTKRVLTKVILETALLTDEEIVLACLLSEEAGADFVKTSTGFAQEGATPAGVALMRCVVGDRMGVKAAGGIRTLADAEAMIRHGASRLGCSASVNIVKEAEARS